MDNKIDELYNALKTYAKLFQDTSTLGNANFSSECTQGNDIIKYFQYSGGYDQYLVSEKFGFKIQSGWTHDTGTFYKILSENIDNIIFCSDYIKKSLQSLEISVY